MSLRLAGFFLPLVLAMAALEWWADGVPNIYSLKRQRFESLANEADTLITGPSGSLHDIRPDLLSGSALNLANPSETLYESDCLITQVLPLLPKLKRVIIQIHYATFFIYRPQNWESWRQYCYQQEWHIPPMRLKDYVDCRMWSRLALRTPRYYLNLLTGAVRGWIHSGKFACDLTDISNMDSRGWQPLVHEQPPPPDLLGAAGVKHALFTLQQTKPEFEQQNLVCLDHILSLLRQHNIEVVFVTTPVWHTFLEVQNQECWNETQKVVAERTNNTSVRYYSFLKAPQLGAQDFWDVDHLNAQGATRFTELLNSAMNQEQQHSNAKTSLDSKNSAR
jgi:hypothetical protein